MFHGTRRRLAAVSLFVAGAFLTTACSSEVGAAAVVDGHRIEVSTVQDAMMDLEPITQGLTQTDLVGLFILEPAWRSVGAEYGVGFTDQQVREYLDEVLVNAELEPREFSQGTIDLLRIDLIQATVLNGPDAQEAVTKVQEHIANSDVVANPRFGNFSTETGLTPVVPEWIVDSPVNL